MRVRPIRNMVNHETNEVFFDNFEIPAENLIGEEGKGFRYILDGMNAERILIAAECIGDGYWFIDRARKYASERVVFDRPIGQNQGIQFPIARAYANVRAADLMRYEAARLFDDGRAVRRRSEHGEAARRRRVVGGGERLPADVRRLRVRGRVRRRAQVSRDAALSGRADLDEHDSLVHRRARARPAEVVLMPLQRASRRRARAGGRRRRSARASSPTSAPTSSRSSGPTAAIRRARTTAR